MAPRKQQKRPVTGPAPAGPDLYAELGLARDASIDDVKRAYRRLALQCHPDKCPGDDAAHEKFQRISMAYSVLSDPQKRRFYDQTGTTEGLDISPDEFMDMFQSLLLEIIGGADMIRDMLSCFTPRELARLPPFPFPKELFPPGTFPPGLRFSSKGLKGLPPQVEELIQGGDLHAMFSAMSGVGMSPPGNGGGSSRRAAGGRSGGGGSGGGRPPGGRPAGTSRHHAARPPPARDPFGYGQRGATHAATASLFAGLFDGPEFDGEEFGDSDGDSDGSGGSSESEWTDVSQSELEAVLGQQRAAEGQGDPPASSPSRANGEPLRGNSTGGAGGSGSGSSSDTASEKLHSPQQNIPSPSPPPLKQQQQSQQPQQPQGTQSPPQQLLVRDWMLAARSCDVAALERLLSQEPRLLGCRGTGMGHTALHWCAAKGSVEGVAWLLGQGMDVNVRNDDGATPLHAAARNGRLEAVEVLLSWRPTAGGSGAPDAPSVHSGSAAAAAAAAAEAAIAAAGAAAAASGPAVCDLAAVDGEGRTALQLALEFQHVHVATLLLRAAAERGYDGQAGLLGTAPVTATVPPGTLDVAALTAEVTEAPAAAAVAASAALPPGSGGRESAASCSGLPGLSAAAEAAGASGLIEAAETAAEAASRSVGDAAASEATPWRPVGSDAAQEPRPPPSSGSERSAAGEGAGGDSTASGSGSSCDSAAATAAAAAPQGPAIKSGSVSGHPEEPGMCLGDGAGDAASGVDDRSASGASDHLPGVSEGVSGGPGGDRSTGGDNCRVEEAGKTGSRQPAPSAPPPPSLPPGQQQRQQQPAPQVGAAADTAAAALTTAAAAAAPPAGGASGSGDGTCTPPPRRSGLTPEEKAARRAALLAADAAAERAEARREAEKAAQAGAAAAAAGLRSREEGKAWLEAARRGDLATLQRMLADNPRLLGYQGQGTNFAFTLHSALHWAVAKGHAAAARWLLQQGADPDLPNAAGATPLHAAASQKADDCARLLVLEAAAKMGVSDSLGETVRDILLRRDTDESGSSGGGGARLASELELLARVAALRDAPGGSSEWAPRAMRSLLAAAGMNIAGLLERRELVDACKQLIAGHPPRIAVSPAAGAAAAAAAAVASRTTAHRTVEPAATAAAAAASSSVPAAAQQPRGTAVEDRSSSAEEGARAQPACPAAASPGGDGSGDGAASADAGAAAAAAAAASDAAKQRGNEAFSRGDFSKAVSHYTMALRLRTEPSAVLYSNRSAAYCGMSYFGKAQADAEEAIRLDPQQPKYRCRLGVALLGQLQFREAEMAFRAALKMDPSYAAAVQGLEDVRAAVARRRP